mmetsp:Transcript_57372/g.94875  ORF Transcript_57372/g.94875 Transcript_57372/m.94875 type:complete len:296 (-) Transcript_57372:1122-2009(-)
MLKAVIFPCFAHHKKAFAARNAAYNRFRLVHGRGLSRKHNDVNGQLPYSHASCSTSIYRTANCGTQRLKLCAVLYDVLKPERLSDLCVECLPSSLLAIKPAPHPNSLQQRSSSVPSEPVLQFLGPGWLLLCGLTACDLCQPVDRRLVAGHRASLESARCPLQQLKPPVLELQTAPQRAEQARRRGWGRPYADTPLDCCCCSCAGGSGCAGMPSSRRSSCALASASFLQLSLFMISSFAQRDLTRSSSASTLLLICWKESYNSFFCSSNSFCSRRSCARAAWRACFFWAAAKARSR